MTTPITDKSFNTSTVTIGTANVGLLTEFHHSNNRAATKTSGVAAAHKTFRGGRNNETLEMGFLGSKCPPAKTTLALAASLNDGTTYSFPGVGLTRVNVTGRKDGTITGSLTGRPSPVTPSTITEADITDVSFNGTTLTLTPVGGGTAIVLSASPNSLNSLTYEGNCAESDNAGSGDTDVMVTPGIPDETLTFEVMGGQSLVPGTVYQVAAAWHDGGTLGSMAYGELMTGRDGGAEDGEITCEYTIKRRASATA